MKTRENGKIQLKTLNEIDGLGEQRVLLEE
jgi:hypothetical protein